ncbi:MAG TPA: flagellar basal body rod protein FlgC [Firmicutes bacterium]|nr:flagellar basal body rod protein FlgC [Bacillota bacterium]
MSIFSAMAISASGMTAERLRMDVIANNIANANTTRTPEGGPYRRQQVLFRAVMGDAVRGYLSRLDPAHPPATGLGVAVVGIVRDPSPPRLVYDPAHPDADQDGYVHMPNVNILAEMVDMLSATRAYEANVTALNAAKSMALKALEIGRG